MHAFLLKFRIVLIRGDSCFIFQKFKFVIQFLGSRSLLPFQVAGGTLSRATASHVTSAIPLWRSDTLLYQMLSKKSLLPNYRERLTLPCCGHLHLLSWFAFQLHQTDLIGATNYHGSCGAHSHVNADVDRRKSWPLNLQSKSHPCVVAAWFR